MISNKPNIIRFCKKKRKKNSVKVRVLKYTIGLALVIAACASTLYFCIDDAPPIKEVQSFTIQDAGTSEPQIKVHEKVAPVEPQQVFDESSIALSDINSENQRLMAQRDIRQLIYPIYNSNKPFNARPNDSCYVLINKNKLSVFKCSNAVVKRFLSVALSKYNDQLSAVFENNKLKFKALLTFE